MPIGGLVGYLFSKGNIAVKEQRYISEFINDHPAIIEELEKANSLEEIYSTAKYQSNKAFEDFFANAEKDDYILMFYKDYRYMYLDYLLKEYSNNVKNGIKDALREAEHKQARLLMEKVNEHYNTNLDFNTGSRRKEFAVWEYYYMVPAKLADHFNKKFNIDDISLSHSAIVKLYKKYVDKFLQ